MQAVQDLVDDLVSELSQTPFDNWKQRSRQIPVMFSSRQLLWLFTTSRSMQTFIGYCCAARAPIRR